MDFCFNLPLLTPYDFSSDLKGCYIDGIYENIICKAFCSKKITRKRKSQTVDTLYIELNLPDLEIFP